MKPLLALIAVAIPLLVGPLAFAQETPVPPTPAPPAAAKNVTVPLGAYDFVVNGDEPLTACVTERKEALDGIFVTLQLFVRLDGGDVVPFAAFPTRATGALADAHVEACFVLTEEVLGG